MGLIWHFPGRQTVVIALINATCVVSNEWRDPCGEGEREREREPAVFLCFCRVKGSCTGGCGQQDI